MRRWAAMSCLSILSTVAILQPTEANELDAKRSPLFALAAFEAYQATCAIKFSDAHHAILNQTARSNGVDPDQADHASVKERFRNQVIQILQEDDVRQNCTSLRGKLRDMFEGQLAFVDRQTQ